MKKKNQCSPDFVRVAGEYTRLLNRHGISYKSLNWGSHESQQVRFQVLAAVGDLNGKEILDVGCGLCDFYRYVDERYMNVSYQGVDITEAMVSGSLQRFPALQIQCRDIVNEPFTTEFDYVFASGIFYLLDRPEQAYRIIREMYRIAKRGVAFNSLSGWAGRQDEGELYLDPGEMVNFCHSLTGRLVLRHDYLPHDFTMYLYKEAK